MDSGSRPGEGETETERRERRDHVDGLTERKALGNILSLLILIESHAGKDRAPEDEETERKSEGD